MKPTPHGRPIAVLGFLVLSLGVVAGRAQQAPLKHPNARPTAFKSILDPIVEDAVARQQIPGAVLVVGHNGRVVYRKAYGWRSIEPVREPMTEDTIFDLASLTKCIATTTAVMKLVQDGRVRLNDPV